MISISNAIKAEQAIVGCIVSDPCAAPVAVSMVSPDHFLDKTSRDMFRAIRDLLRTGKPVNDHQLIADCLSTDLEEISQALDSVYANYFESQSIEHYCRIVKTAAEKRQAAEAISSAYESIHSGACPLESAMAVKTVIESISHGEAQRRIRSTKDVLKSVLDVTQNDAVLKTGYESLDEILCGGFRAGEFCVIGAAPGVGKTTLAMNIAHRIRHLDGTHAKVLFVSMEMSADSIMQRWIAMESNIPLGEIKRALGGVVDQDKALETIGMIGKTVDSISAKDNISIYDGGSITPAGFAGVMANYGRDVDAVFIDYIQRGKPERNQDRMRMITDFSRECKDAAKKYNVAVIAVASLSRGAYRESDTRPNMSHLRDCGEIEFDADQIFFLWRERNENNEVEELEVDIAKQRNGATGLIRLRICLPYCKIIDKEEPTPKEARYQSW